MSWWNEPISAEPAPLTLDKLLDWMRPKRIVMCAPGDELAIRRAVNELEAEGYRVEVRPSDYVKVGTVLVLNPAYLQTIC